MISEPSTAFFVQVAIVVFAISGLNDCDRAAVHGQEEFAGHREFVRDPEAPIPKEERPQPVSLNLPETMDGWLVPHPR